MLNEDAHTKNLTDTPTVLTDVSEKKDKDKVSDSAEKLSYEMTKQEAHLQEEEEKNGIYMSTFGYEGDDSNLDSGTDTKSDVTTYPYLDRKKSSTYFSEQEQSI